MVWTLGSWSSVRTRLKQTTMPSRERSRVWFACEKFVSLFGRRFVVFFSRESGWRKERRFDDRIGPKTRAKTGRSNLNEWTRGITGLQEKKIDDRIGPKTRAKTGRSNLNEWTRGITGLQEKKKKLSTLHLPSQTTFHCSQLHIPGRVEAHEYAGDELFEDLGTFQVISSYWKSRTNTRKLVRGWKCKSLCLASFDKLNARRSQRNFTRLHRLTKWLVTSELSRSRGAVAAALEGAERSRRRPSEEWNHAAHLQMI